MGMQFLLVAAVLPVFILCFFVYKKDPHREPGKILAKIFIFGFLSAIPILFVELLLGSIFPTEGVSNFILIFVNVFISVALVEEGFKWMVTMFFGYKNKEFDEIYDIIVYAVFASLGFACIENILFVFTRGIGNAILRALLSIPGHMSFGVIMGYFLAQAKVGKINKNTSIYQRNMILSILLPTIAHTLYDAFLFYTEYNVMSIVLFFIFDICMVTVCIITINKMSKIQQNVDTNLNTGVLRTTENGQLVFTGVSSSEEIHYCPVCGNNVDGCNYCAGCGFKIK
jgi:RsiW-degrading membrane proteinase PrsW (M82 family)